MKNTICLNCGEIITNGDKCPNCKKSNSLFNDILQESKDIYRYGYSYRKFYENQERSSGQINCKASLYMPETLPELLTAAALAGIVGNFSYHIFTIFAKKLLTLIKGDEERDKYSEIIKIVTNDEELRLFFQYVSDYYWQLPTKNLAVDKSIEEEEMADFISDSTVSNGIKKTFEMENKVEAEKLRLEIIKKAYKDWNDYKKNKKSIEESRLKELLTK